jgi:hypothetical protein
MKSLTVFVLAALSMAICVPGNAQKTDFPLTVHVESSDFAVSCNPDYTCYGLQKLNVKIDGKKYILASEDGEVVTGMGRYMVSVLKNGDYAARIVKDETDDAGEYHRVIELQTAPGAKKRYTVVGEGAN